MTDNKILRVYFENYEVGQITADELNRMSFKYLSYWLSNLKAFWVSITMPFREMLYPPRYSTLVFR
ncbi:MAG: HipA N-terminal domain-containing protein [Candidatus Fermentibacteria bacterium]|nr:HipA N-terminal domain-containing protein [Candidatus Fermentibacteria bacterium]